MATQIFKQLEHETLIDILNFQSTSPVKDDISRKMAVKYLLEDIAFNGVKNLIQELKLDELIKATSHLKIDHGTNNPKSKMVLSKRLKESFEEYGPSEWLNNCGDESVLKTFAHILRIKDAQKLSVKALRPAIDNEISVTGLITLFENLNIPLLKKCCEELEIENYEGVSAKSVLVKAIVFDVPIAAPEKKKKKAVRVGAKKSIEKCNEYEQLFQHYTLEQLVDWCKERDVKTSGTKKVVINRILAYNDGDRENTMVDASNRSPKQTKKSDTKEKSKPKKAKLPSKQSEEKSAEEEDEADEDVEEAPKEKATKKKVQTKKANKKNTKKAAEDEEKSAEEEEAIKEVKEKEKKKGGKKAAAKDKKMKEKSAEEEEDNKSAEEEVVEEVKEKTKTKGAKKNDKKIKEKSAEEEDNKSAEEDEEVVEEVKEKKKAGKKVADKKIKEKQISEEEEQPSEEAEVVEKKKSNKKAPVDKKKETKKAEEDSNEEEEKEQKKANKKGADKKAKEASEEANDASENEASETLNIEAAIAAERKLRTNSVEPSESVTSSEEEDADHPRVITGVHFAINGQLSLKQDVVKTAIEEAGGVVCAQLTKKVNVLITNNDATSSKFDKARSAGIKIVTEDYLVHILAPYRN